MRMRVPKLRVKKTKFEMQRCKQEDQNKVKKRII